MTFKVGDIAIIQKAAVAEWNGTEVVVKGGLETRTLIDSFTGEKYREPCYIVHNDFGTQRFALPYQLRKPDDGAAPGAWEDLADIWTPPIKIDHS